MIDANCFNPAGLPYQFIASSPVAGTVVVPFPNVPSNNNPCSSTLTLTVGGLVGPSTSFPTNIFDYVGITSTPGNRGYVLVNVLGVTSGFGDAASATAHSPGFPGPGFPEPVVGHAAASGASPSPMTSPPVWIADAAGAVDAYDAPFYGSMGGTPLNSPVVGIASTPDHGGYWLVATDGGVFSFGDAGFYGSVPGALKPGQSLNQPIVGIASTADGKGYWMVASDGGVFAFGDAPFWGSMGGKALNKPIVGVSGNTLGGYWLVASDGGIFSFNAAFEGSLGSIVLNAPITGMAATDDGKGYWMLAADGGVFAFGDAPFWGSRAGS